MKPRTSNALVALAFSAFTPLGCATEEPDDASEYRQALPEATSVRLEGPGQSQRGSGTAASGSAGELLADGAAPAAALAKWYGFTRNVRDGINVVTAGVLGSVWFVAHTRPTKVGQDFAEWGPHTEALDPVTWRLRIERVQEHQYRYALEGRPRASRSEADYLTVVSGTGHGRTDARHGDGEFTIDLDAARALDPARHADDFGTVTIAHDLPASGARLAALPALPREITANLDHPGDAWLTVVSNAHEDGTGRLDVTGSVDVDESKATALEEVEVLSRWRADGAGRADGVIAEGDVPKTIGLISVAECWASDFSRVYYSDSVNAEPTAGDPSACVYEASDD